MAEHNYLGNMEGPCLYRFNCGHYCQEQINHRFGLMHGLCLTLVNVELGCGHIELIHCYECYENDLFWRCNICRTLQPIRRIFEDATAAANRYFELWRYRVQDEIIRPSAGFAQIGEGQHSVGAPISSVKEQEARGVEVENNEAMDTQDASDQQTSSSSENLIQIGDANLSEQPSTSQTQSGPHFKLGKRNFDETFPSSEDFDDHNHKIEKR